jgi:hypothetical protein
LSNAVVGALIAAKAVLLLDETSLVRGLEHQRRVVAIALKMIFYGTACLVLGYLERFLEALHKTNSFRVATQQVIAHSNHYRLFAWVLGISIVFALYFSFAEIGAQLGDRQLAKLFFDRPGTERF